MPSLVKLVESFVLRMQDRDIPGYRAWNLHIEIKSIVRTTLNRGFCDLVVLTMLLILIQYRYRDTLKTLNPAASILS